MFWQRFRIVESSSWNGKYGVGDYRNLEQTEFTSMTL